MPHRISEFLHTPDRNGLALANRNFKPIERFLEKLRQDISQSGEGILLDRRELLHKTAKDTYQVRYSIHDESDARLSLTFILTGENADKILFQSHQRSMPRNVAANPGQIDQHVYRLNEMTDLMQVVQEKVTSHLRA